MVRAPGRHSRMPSDGLVVRNAADRRVSHVASTWSVTRCVLPRPVAPTGGQARTWIATATAEQGERARRRGRVCTRAGPRGAGASGRGRPAVCRPCLASPAGRSARLRHRPARAARSPDGPGPSWKVRRRGDPLHRLPGDRREPNHRPGPDRESADRRAGSPLRSGHPDAGQWAGDERLDSAPRSQGHGRVLPARPVLPRPETFPPLSRRPARGAPSPPADDLPRGSVQGRGPGVPHPS